MQTVFRDEVLQILIMHLVDIIVLSSSLGSVSFFVQKLTSWDKWYLLMVLKLILKGRGGEKLAQAKSS